MEFSVQGHTLSRSKLRSLCHKASAFQQGQTSLPSSSVQPIKSSWYLMHGRYTIMWERILPPSGSLPGPSKG